MKNPIQVNNYEAAAAAAAAFYGPFYLQTPCRCCFNSVVTGTFTWIHVNSLHHVSAAVRVYLCARLLWTAGGAVVKLHGLQLLLEFLLGSSHPKTDPLHPPPPFRRSGSDVISRAALIWTDLTQQSHFY